MINLSSSGSEAPSLSEESAGNPTTPESSEPRQTPRRLFQTTNILDGTHNSLGIEEIFDELRDLREVRNHLGVLQSRQREQELENEKLRGLIRRLRFSNETRESKNRRDSTFFDGARRRLLQFWDGDPNAFNSVQPPQLAFLLLLLDIQKPASSS